MKKKRNAEDVLRAIMGTDEPADDTTHSGRPVMTERGAEGEVVGGMVVAPLDDLGFAAAAGAASGAYRILDLLSIGVGYPQGYAAGVEKARQLLGVALWQLNGAETIRARRVAEAPTA